MADWSPLRERLRTINDGITIPWHELDALVGGLPPSATKHAAFWGGDRSAWRGFAAQRVRVGVSVTFVRRGVVVPSRRSEDDLPAAKTDATSDLILVGCVKSKLDHPAAARDLYTSPLFRKARAYAERSGAPWFVLSAEHGLVRPETQLAPYDLRLASTTRAHRREWGIRVLGSLHEEIGSLDGLVVEIHAGAPYVDALERPLTTAGAAVVNPLQGLTMGQRLAWYPRADVVAESPGSPGPSLDVAELVVKLKDETRSLAVDELDRKHMSIPGLYSWWVDGSGASDLATGLQEPVSPGLVYAGLAGATRERSGRVSSNTLWGRINGMHLGKRHSFSTFRRSLGSVLAELRGDSEIDEDALTTWMREHLRVVALPVADAATLNLAETAVLAELDPPLNLAKVPKTPLRIRLSDLRKRYTT